MEKIYITWSEFHQDVKALCAQIKEKGHFNKIVAVSRGGFVPAGIAAYELDIRNTAVVNVATYVGDEHLTIEKVDNLAVAGQIDDKTLIFDDLADSGQTIHVLRRAFPQATYVTVYAKPKGKSETDLFAKEIPDKWVVFPWDI